MSSATVGDVELSIMDAPSASAARGERPSASSPPQVTSGNKKYVVPKTHFQAFGVVFFIVSMIFIGLYVNESNKEKDMEDGLDGVYHSHVVVGAGVAGTYAAWRLQTDNPSRKVQLFERTERVGGKYYSEPIGCLEGSPGATPQNIPRCEIGGMRIRNYDYLIHKIKEQLNIPWGTFWMNDENNAGINDDPRNPIFINGKIYIRGVVEAMKANGTIDQLGLPALDAWINTNNAAEDQPPYYNDGLAPDTENYGFQYFNSSGNFDPCNGDANAAVVNQKFPTVDSGGVSEDLKYLDLSSDATATLFGGVSNNGFHFDNTFGGYFGKGMFTNADEPVMYDDVYVKTGYTRPLKGTQDIPVSMEKAFRSDGGTTYMNTQLISIEENLNTVKERKGRLRLTFQPTITGKCDGITRRDGDKENIIVYTDNLVLGGIPVWAMEAVTNKLAPPQRNQLMEITKSVYGMRYTKYFIAFKTSELDALNEDEKLKDWKVGRYTTDLAIQQIFKWYPGTQAYKPENEGFNPECDLTVLQFYDSSPIESSLLTQTPNINAACPAVGSDKDCSACPVKAPHAISDDALAMIISQLALALNVAVTDIPEPVNTLYRHYSSDDPQTRANAWHQWKPRTDYTTLFEKALKPIDELPIYNCGETFSAANQGWGEGAAQTAEYMLQERMGIAPPIWLSEKEYCDVNPVWRSSRKHFEKNLDNGF